MQTLSELTPYRHRYNGMEHQCLKVTANLTPGSPVGTYDAINLDNLLAAAVVIDCFGHNELPNSREPYQLPLPLRCLWRSEEGLPLWASTNFLPEGDSESDVIYWHKRAMSGRFTLAGNGRPLQLSTAHGRWMERRVPMPVRVCEKWTATCIGNPDEIVRLIGHIRYLGKKRAIGFGEVAYWTVEAVSAFELWDEQRLLRPVPEAAKEVFEDRVSFGVPSPLVGWTPPQWLPSLWATGWRCGTPIAQPAEETIDYFEAMGSF